MGKPKKKGEKNGAREKVVVFEGGLLIVLIVLSSALAAETVTVTGEIIDTYCFALMGAKGESHRQCAIECVQKGIPAGILEDGTNKV